MTDTFAIHTRVPLLRRMMDKKLQGERQRERERERERDEQKNDRVCEMRP